MKSSKILIVVLTYGVMSAMAATRTSPPVQPKPATTAVPPKMQPFPPVPNPPVKYCTGGSCTFDERGPKK